MRAFRTFETGAEEGYFASVSDLVIGLLFLFIILLMAYSFNFRSAEQETERLGQELARQLAEAEQARDRLARERDQLARAQQRLEGEQRRLLRERITLRSLLARIAGREALRAEMLATVADLLAEREIAVAIEPEKGVLRLPEDLLFNSGEAELRPEGLRTLRAVAQVLARTLPCYSGAPRAARRDCPAGSRPVLEAVLIEGHTDDLPIHGGRFHDNWELSAARGVNTYKALTAFEPSLDQLTNARGEALLGVAAYEARRPVSRAPTPQGRRLNRRIDLRFVLAAPSRREVEQIRRQLPGPGTEKR